MLLFSSTTVFLNTGNKFNNFCTFQLWFKKKNNNTATNFLFKALTTHLFLPFRLRLSPPVSHSAPGKGDWRGSTVTSHQGGEEQPEWTRASVTVRKVSTVTVNSALRCADGGIYLLFLPQASLPALMRKSWSFMTSKTVANGMKSSCTSVITPGTPRQDF